MRIRLIASLVIVLVVESAIAVRGDSPTSYRFRANLQTTSRLVAVPQGRCEDPSGNAPTIGLLEVTGAGESNLLGPVIDQQSHCVRADGTFFQGRFVLTNAAGRTLRGRYSGTLEPTFNSTFPPPAPEGSWLIRGQVCISGGDVADIANTCARDLYEPARGITNLTTGDATIFLDQTLRIR
jgi:hypothetical protein